MFKDFALKSGIRGFSYAETSNKSVRLMWYGIMLICVGMTIYDVSGTVRYFMSFPTTTNFMVINNHPINLGSPTLSLSYSNTIDNLNEFKNGSKKDIYELLESVKHYYTGNSSFMLSKEPETFVQAAVSLIVAVVSSVTRAEHYLTDNTLPYDLSWGYYVQVDSENETNIIHKDGADQVEFAYRWLLANNISLRKAAVVTVQLVCNLLHFTIKQPLKKSKRNCEVIKPSWIGMQPGIDSGFYDQLISFQIPSQFFNFGFSFEETTVKMTRPLKFFDQKLIPSSYIRLDFSGSPTMLRQTINVVYHRVDTTGWVIAAIAAHYKQLDTLRSPCSANDYFSNCQFKHRKEMIRDLCGCSPLDLAEHVNVEKECSVEVFQQPANTNCSKRTTEYVPLQRSHTCYQKCYRPAMWFTQGRSDSNEKTNETSITVQVDVFNYPLFEEIPLLEPKQILGSLGGNLSLYLGANFMLLYYTVFYWVTSLFRKVFQRQTV